MIDSQRGIIPRIKVSTCTCKWFGVDLVSCISMFFFRVLQMPKSNVRQSVNHIVFICCFVLHIRSGLLNVMDPSVDSALQEL